MGARLSLLAPSAPTIAISSYVDILDNIQYIELINNSRFLKTIKAVDLKQSNGIIIKILIKPNNINLNLAQITELLVKESSLLAQYNYYLPYQKLIETDRAGYLIRQSIKINLYDRLSIRPFLESVEKRFIVFQLLKLIDNLHRNLSIYHGDLKLENVMVSSSNWIILTDFANYIKPVFIPEDNSSQFSFYFDTSDRRVCNLAPERFYNSTIGLKLPLKHNFDDNNNFNGLNQLTPEMDLFSLGCIIGELFLDGEPLFTLSGLFKFMKNEYIPDLSGIDPLIQDIIMKLISFDPVDRITSFQILADYRNVLFPSCFYTFLYEFIRTLNNTDIFIVEPHNDSITPSDLRIDFIYTNFKDIIEGLQFDYNKSDFIPGRMFLNLPGMPKNYQIQSLTNPNNCSLIILDFIFSIINTLKRPSSKIKACELIVALSEHINDECKLDRATPYLCKLIDEYISSTSVRQFSVDPSIIDDTSSCYSSRVVVVALESIVSLLDSCSYITPLNVLTFPEYLLPKLSKLITSESINTNGKQLIKIQIAVCLPKLAEIANRFWMMTKSFKNNNHTVPLDMIHGIFEDLAVLLLTDDNPKIKASLVDNIYPLCRFLGVDKTNDIILPHLITYLNDPDSNLRLYFLNSILNIGPFVGLLSFEQYLLPLLIQTLSDTEQLVVLKVLKVFVVFVNEKLINPSHFNVLAIYKELLVNTTPLLLHPNEWIRQSVLHLILAIADNLVESDKFCFLYPEIRRYLSYDITKLDWNTLYPCITRPLTKITYQLLIAWCNSSSQSEKSIFWNDNSLLLSPGKLTDFTKDLGKSVFLKSSTTTPTNTPLSHKDKQWILKLKGVGLEERDFWKIYSLRPYISGVTKGIAPQEFTLSTNIDIVPRNIFYEINYKSEPIATVSKGFKANVTQDFQLDVKVTKAERSGSNSLVLPNITRVNASIQTSEENVFGELENDPHHHLKLKYVAENGFNHKVVSSDDEKVIIADYKHSYTGHNPYIFNYLDEVKFEMSLDSFNEFGNPVKPPKSQSKDWIPQSKCVSRINTNNVNSGNTDDLRCIAVNPSSEFFITGSEEGVLKVWDTQKLEKNIMFKNPSLITHLKSAILDVKFMESRNVVAVSCKNGKIFVFRVDFTRGKNNKIVKFSKLSMIRKYYLDNEYAMVMKFASDTILVIATSSSKILGVNIITMDLDFTLQNPLNHGIVTSFITNRVKEWLVVGTSKGRFCLWDNRFGILVKVWRIVADDCKPGPIKQMILLSSKPDSWLFAVIGGVLDSNITIWDLRDLQCKQVLGSYTKDPVMRRYSSEEVQVTEISQILDELSTELEQGFTSDHDITFNDTNSMVFYKHASGDYLVNNIQSNRLIFWKLGDLENSVSQGFYFTKNMIDKTVVTNERLDNDGVLEGLNLQAINGICVVSAPYEMVILVDREGYISIFV